MPILTRLADYQGEADLLPMLRRALNRGGIELASELVCAPHCKPATLTLCCCSMVSTR